MKKFSLIVLINLIWSVEVFAGTLINTRWIITPLPLETTNRPYEIMFLFNDKCKYKKAHHKNYENDVTCIWKYIDKELHYTINDYSFTKAKVIRNVIKGDSFNLDDKKWKIVGEKLK